MDFDMKTSKGIVISCFGSFKIKLNLLLLLI